MDGVATVWLAWDGDLLLGIYASNEVALEQMSRYLEETVAEYHAFTDLFNVDEAEYVKLARQRIRVVEYPVTGALPQA